MNVQKKYVRFRDCVRNVPVVRRYDPSNGWVYELAGYGPSIRLERVEVTTYIDERGKLTLVRPSEGHSFLCAVDAVYVIPRGNQDTMCISFSEYLKDMN